MQKEKRARESPQVAAEAREGSESVNSSTRTLLHGGSLWRSVARAAMKISTLLPQRYSIVATETALSPQTSNRVRRGKPRPLT